jgi:FAD/FMN-containing dehydrogenase
MGSNSPIPATTSFAESARELGSCIQGQLLLPGDAEYDSARRGWNLTVDAHPALIVIPESAADIVEAVRFAAGSDLDIAVTTTGHGTVRPANDCLLINLSRMTGVSIDRQNQTARIEGGAKWGHVLPKAQEAGLAPLLGSSPDVGAVGYTLGGGFGWLGRKYGLAVDSALEFEVVAADSRMLRASAEENSDLFWGLRGGGGSLAIVTAMKVKLYPVTNVYGGNLIYPMEIANEILSRYRQWIKDLPDEMTSSVTLMNVPPLPIVPEFLRGKSVVFVRGCYCGDLEQGQALVDSWRQWREPLFDMFAPMPFASVAQISSDPEDPLPSTFSGAWLREFSDTAVEALVSFMRPSAGPPPIVLTEIRQAGGAISRVDPGGAAYGNRQEELLMFVTGMTPTPEAQQEFAHYTARMKEAMGAALSDRVYMNFLEGSESADRVRDGFSATAYRRLSQLKARFDPANRLNRALQIVPGE